LTLLQSDVDLHIKNGVAAMKLVGLFALACLVGAGSEAVAEDVMDAEDIVKSLRASAAPGREMSAEDIVSSLRARIAVLPREGEQAAAPLATPEIDNAGQVSLEIFFDYNSANIRTESFQSLLTLAQALASPELVKAQIMIVGHTDSAGSREYNLSLSERRANSVKVFLAASSPGAGNRLVSIGFGEEKPRNASNPESSENRRVQVINLGG
jgi:OmpA-OmpF porin, OOP family